MIDLLGHVLYLFLLGGMLLLARQNRIGWLVRMTGSLGWGVLGFFLGMTSIMTWCAVFASLDVYGYLKWKRKDETTPTSPADRR